VRRLVAAFLLTTGP